MTNGHIAKHRTPLFVLDIKLLSKRITFIALSVFCLWQGDALAEIENNTPKPFPKILTLADALQMLDQGHPSILGTQAGIAAVNARQLAIKESTALKANLNLELRQADRIGIPGHDFINDSRAVFTLDKPLTNFGKDKILTNALETEQIALTDSLAVDNSNLRVAIIKAFFDVIIADYAYAVYDEEMTITFLPFNDARENLERYQEVSELEVQHLESLYFTALQQRQVASNERRAARLRLALALNKPNSYPDQLIEPDLSGYQRDLPDYDELLATVLENSPEIRSLNLQLQAAKQQLDYIAGASKPTLGARFQALEYEDKSSTSRDQFRASLYLDIPLNTKRQNFSSAAKQQSKILKIEANRAELIQQYRIHVLVLVQQLEQLQFEVSAAASNLLYSELNLDKSRQEYEMELRTRLGRANADLAHALHREIKAKYQWALAWEMIDALTINEPVIFN